MRGAPNWGSRSSFGKPDPDFFRFLPLPMGLLTFEVAVPRQNDDRLKISGLREACNIITLLKLSTTRVLAHRVTIGEEAHVGAHYASSFTI
jgi:hypothetical protein